MKTDGERDLEIKRNTPLGVTEEGGSVKGIRPSRPDRVKKKEISIFVPLPPSFPLAKLSLWEKRSIFIC